MDNKEKSALSYWRQTQGLTARPGVAIRRDKWRRYLVRSGALDADHSELDLCKLLDRVFDAFLDHRLASERSEYHSDSDRVRQSAGYDA